MAPKPGPSWVTHLIDRINRLDLRPQTALDLRIWQVVLIPTYLHYRFLLLVLPAHHLWKRMPPVSYDRWCQHATSLTFVLGLVLTYLLFTVIGGVVCLFR